ncbi:hypothetical protein B0H14DRAFT_3877673 [Mycena olivaceomarginata]|nr:hypothetical protein B0H14DRAFT_3877673 [Mycena olivaceomarginata]
MFSLAYLSVLAVVALGPQVVLGSFKFSLTPVVQCQPVSINFTGSDSNNHSVPITLTILPLLDNVAPIQIPIPNGASNSTGIELTFIPLPAGTRFVASLDDINGRAATVSDVTKVLNSTTGPDVDSCFGSSLSPVKFYEFDDTLGQCENFTITYHTALAPTIKAFNPRGGSVKVPPTNASTAPNTASYTMNVVRDLEVVLLLDDTQGNLQTTKLITITGDSSSSKSCFKTSSSKDSNGKNSKMSSSTKLPQSAVIGIAVGATIVGIFGILLLIYVLRARRRNRRASGMNFDPALLNQKWPPDLEERKIELYQSPPTTAPSTLTPSFGQGFVRDPIYTNEKYASSIVSDDARTSIGSWNQFVPDDQQQSRREPHARTQSVSSSRLSMGTVEIQDILQMATVHRTRSSGGATVASRPLPQPSTAGTTMTFDVAKPAMARLVSTRRSRRTSDAPDMPVTMSRNNSTEAAIAGVPTKYRSSYASFDREEYEDNSGGGIGGYPIPSFKTGNLRPRDTSESWGNVGG